MTLLLHHRRPGRHHHHHNNHHLHLLLVHQGARRHHLRAHLLARGRAVKSGHGRERRVAAVAAGVPGAPDLSSVGA